LTLSRELFFETLESTMSRHQPAAPTAATPSKVVQIESRRQRDVAIAQSERQSAETGWLNDFKSLAKSTKDTILPAIDGIANIIHRSAMTVAAEIAQLERDAELDAERWRAENFGSPGSKSSGAVRAIPLPWEVLGGTKSKKHSKGSGYATTTATATAATTTDAALKARMLQLSKEESTFLEPFTTEHEEGGDVFALSDSRIEVIRRLLDIDENLASMHARLSGRSHVKESVFWRNYFYHCDMVRKEHRLTSTLSEDDDDDDDEEEEDEDSMRSSLGSLVPAADSPGGAAGGTTGDDSSYVCVRNSIASPPSSLNTLTETMSVGDMVVVGDAAEITALDMK